MVFARKLILPILIYININKLVTSLSCFTECKCSWIAHSLAADCSGLGLTNYSEIPDIPIEQIDYSNNRLTRFPYEFSKIETLSFLDLSQNNIHYLEENALEGFTALQTLLLSNNSFNSWKDINPNVAFKGAINLKTVSLAGNQITSFSNADETYILISHSLTLLDLSHCQIQKISGEYILSGMRSLERLILNDNPINILNPIESDSLNVLELSNCKLGIIKPDTFDYMKNLISLDMSKNPDINLLPKSDIYAKSESLKMLDLSFCNLDKLEIMGFPNLNTLIYRGNMIRRIEGNDFVESHLLEYLDLSRNSISYLDPLAFNYMYLIKKIDLSFNVILKIHPSTFSTNLMLIELNLSRNYINRFSKIISNSLAILNLSWCEILGIDKNALHDMVNLTKLNLSNNLISDFPFGLKSNTLQDLDLSMCRLSSIDNSSFKLFPELTKLKLSGNRFTTTLEESYFARNLYLSEVWLGDNPWMCFCKDNKFFNFYLFINDKNKIKDKKHLRCASPLEFYGQTWEKSCFPIWYPNHNIGNAEKIWTIIMIIIMCGAILFCLFTAIRKIRIKLKRRLNFREYQRNYEERERIREQNASMLTQEAQLNAPDARESNPPCYEDALLMPQLERSFKSMDELRSNHKKIKRNKTDTNMNESKDFDDIVDESILSRHRFLSEERLSNRDKERTDIGREIFRRTGRIPRTESGTRLYFIEDKRFPASYLKSQNLESAEQIANLQNYRNSPYSDRKWKMHANSISFASISDDEIGCHRTSMKKNSFEMILKPSHSPYSRRRPRGLSISQLSISNDKNISQDSVFLPNDENKLEIISDHFKKYDNFENISLQSNNNSEFENITPLRDCENASNSNYSEDDIKTGSFDHGLVDEHVVIIHHPMKESKI